MEIFVPKDQVKEVFETLAREKVSCQVTGEVYDLMVGNDKIAEVAVVQADLLETDVPVIYDPGPRSPSGPLGSPPAGNSSSPTPTAISSASWSRPRAGNAKAA